MKFRKFLEVILSTPPLVAGVALVLGIVWLTLSLFGAPNPPLIAIVATGIGLGICLKAETFNTAIRGNYHKSILVLWLERRKREFLIARAPRYSTELFRSPPSAMFLELPRGLRKKVYPGVPTATEARTDRTELAYAYAGVEPPRNERREFTFVAPPGAEA